MCLAETCLSQSFDTWLWIWFWAFPGRQLYVLQRALAPQTLHLLTLTFAKVQLSRSCRPSGAQAAAIARQIGSNDGRHVHVGDAHVKS